jgi:hypothetical protein
MIAVLFARPDSVYKTLPELDVYDIERDARTYSGNLPVIAHPPCRAWGRLRHFAKPRPDEKDLAIFAVDQVRRCGGVLEHPYASSLWPAARLPRPGQRDSYGGYTLPVYQGHWGHRAPKATWLYIVGVEPAELPDIAFDLALPVGRIADHCTKSEREATPALFALWLVDLVGRVQMPGSYVIPGKSAMGCTNTNPPPASSGKASSPIYGPQNCSARKPFIPGVPPCLPSLS